MKVRVVTGTDFFYEGNFRHPITKFVSNLLVRCGIHISQVSSLRMVRVTHFGVLLYVTELNPKDMFNVLDKLHFKSLCFMGVNHLSLESKCLMP
ncbi:hypothetical protein Hanom_Chr09g00809051 [Helianthus anomalus]